MGGSEKGQPGPPLPGNQPGPDPFDPLSPNRPGSRSSATRLRGIDYKFSASIKNTGNKTITSVQWAYFFVPQNTSEGFAYLFTTKINIPPGKEKDLHDQGSIHGHSSQSEQSAFLYKTRALQGTRCHTSP